MAEESAVEKLRSLKVFPDLPEHPNNIREHIKIFEKCKTLDDIVQVARKEHWGAGSGQFVYFHLHALLASDSAYKLKFLEEAKKDLADSGIKPEHIEEYFQSSRDPGISFSFDYSEEYDLDTRKSFYQRADQFALDKMREWLGFE
ncbi:hypothetical protein JXB11_00260 [Candidatus Woesearchaeota archaeon]|nr:hypothetical protein [Candidatus Woesearchaeota archaeon]